MRKIIKIPRILKINYAEGLIISVVFNNGESRLIDFEQLYKSLQLEKLPQTKILLDNKELKKAKIQNNTLSWENVAQYISTKQGIKQEVAFEIGADILYQFSTKIEENNMQLGSKIRDLRRRMGLSQEKLAALSGTSRTYISRIENNHSDIELSTLQKIIEIGLGKKMEVRIR